MSVMKRKKDRYVALDTTRGAAIIIIVSCHFLLFDGIHGAGAIGRAMADIGNFIFFAFPLNRLSKNVNLFLTQKCHVDK